MPAFPIRRAFSYCVLSPAPRSIYIDARDEIGYSATTYERYTCVSYPTYFYNFNTIAKRGKMRRSILLLILSFFVFAAVAQTPSEARAQGWRLFTNKLKEDKQKQKDGGKKNAETDAASDDEEEDAPPLFDVTRKDRENDAEDDYQEPEFIDEEDAPKASFQRESASVPASNRGMLDFSDALGDDAADYADNEPDEPRPQTFDDAMFKSEPPSYRGFPEQQADARLNDVVFVDPVTGWAVGDRGTVLHTEDAGQTWVAQEVPTDANLFAVSFLDENYGLAVGGRALPIAHVGQGVVLRTVDGGTTWTEVETASFPILRDVKILDEDAAWIAGDSSNIYPSGLFFSADTGIEWTRVEGNKRQGWRNALYDPDERLGVGVTVEGRVQRVDGAQAQETALSLGTSRVNDVAFDGENGRAWIVGDRGLALYSSDFGANWSQTPGGFPNDAQNYFDLRSVAAAEGLVGCVGSPGSMFFYTEDGGKVWDAARTGVNTPLQKLTFVDAQRGWAVGDLGVIVATTDGGKTWNVQRNPGKRSALLAFLARPSDAPLEAFTQIAGDEGFLTEIALVAREADKEGRSEEIPYVERFNEALVEVGACGLDQASLFILNPVEQRDSIDQILARFDAENDGDGLLRFRERLVRLIRVWRPSAIMTVDPTLDDGYGDSGPLPRALDPKTPGGAKALIGALADANADLDARPRDAMQELLLRELPGAVKAAADPTAYPEHLAACNLEPWRVKKARLLCRGKTQGNMTIDSSYFCASLGRPIAEIAGSSRAILGDSSETRDAVSFQTLFSSAAPKYADKTFFDGLDIPYASDARRARVAALSDSVDEYASRAADRRQKLGVVDSLARRSVNDRKSADLLLAQLRSNIQGADASFAVEYLTTAGRRFASLGNWNAAEEAFSLVALELLEEPQSREAIAWLAQYYAGDEPERRILAQGDASLNDSKRDRLNNAKNLGESIRDFAPETFMAPEIRFPLAAAARKLGDVESAARFYQARSQASGGDVWALRAAAEYWLLSPSNDLRAEEAKYCPIGLFSCRRLAARPYLDGTPEPTAWENAQRLDLSTPYQEAPNTREETDAERETKALRKRNRAFTKTLGTNVAIAYDSEFLYIAANCRKAPEIDYQNATGATKGLTESLNNAANENVDADEAPRPRDADLSLYDRLEFVFDVDGDYATAYKFVFDCRGWVYDSNWNDPSWNPGVFVAKTESNTTWSLEIAIPLAELVDHAPRAGEVWRAAVRRVAPGAGVECWNVENSDSGENAFGFMTFN